MPSLSAQEFAKLAQIAAGDLVEKNIPLNDSVDKLAAQHAMNEEQLRRLCEASNNAAFNALFEARGKSGSADRMVDFDVAKPAEILRRRIGQEKAAMSKTASSAAPVERFEAFWERRPLAAPVAAETVKTAAALPRRDEPADALSERRAHRDAGLAAAAFDKAISHLRHEKIAAQFAYSDAGDRLYRHFRATDRRPKFASFEKDAMALYGAAAEAPLDNLRRRLGLPEVTRHYEKVASRIVVSTKGEEYQLLKSALDALERVRDIDAALSAPRG